MRILLLTHSFNSLSQRLFVELADLGHQVSVELDIHEQVTIEAVRLHRPHLVVAPYLRRAIPESIWRNHVCWVVHPGVKGDRGPSALDWAILGGESQWGVTVLQANAEMDAGDIWAEQRFAMREARKSSLYRYEVTEAAVKAVRASVERFETGGFRPEALDYARPDVRGRWRPAMRQSERAIDWRRDDTSTVLRKIRSADGFPGVLDEVFGIPCHLYDAHPEDGLGGTPGAVIARRDGAMLRATADGAAWIGQVRLEGDAERNFKLPATRAFADRLHGVPERAIGLKRAASPTYQEIWYEEKGAVGYLHFDFYNGAMSTEQCQRLLRAYGFARQRPTRVVVLMGGRDFWSNGMHLNVIEAAESPADESWRNINAIDDVAEAIINTDSHLTIAALQGNAAAGGAFLALSADRVFARGGVVLNPHYKAMGNLYGSEYWTYLLPHRVGEEQARALTESRLPVGAQQAQGVGFLDECFGESFEAFRLELDERARALANDPGFPRLLAEKHLRRARHEQSKPLARYRAEELEHMKLNFYGFDPSYHVARYNFVYKIPHSWTPLHLALHRRLGAATPSGALAR